jgi:predicted ATP-binding protein involved in virulence
MINIKQLIIKNIGPFEEEKFDFSIQKGHPNIHIFTGANGGGKTTLLHAIASAFDYFEEGHKEHLSNNFYKRFHTDEEDEKEMSKSFAHAIITDNKEKVVDKIICYNCMHCKTIHQEYQKTMANNLSIGRTANAYSKKSLSNDLTYYKNAIIAEDISNKKFKFAAFGYSGYRLIKSGHIQFDAQETFNPLKLALEFVKERDTGAMVSNWIASRYSKAAIEEIHGNKEVANRYRVALNCLIDCINELTNNEYKFEIKTNPWKVCISYFGKEIEFDVLPDGLRSLLSWLGDLLVRLDEIPWEDASIPVNEQHIILLLDEIEVHLHPKWQYQILPLVQKVFPNAQIFLSTHSPFILNSIDNAKIYKLNSINGISKLEDVILSNTGHSYNYVYENILETFNRFSAATMKDLKRFNELDAELVRGNQANETEFIEVVKRLFSEGEEVTDIISSKLIRLQKITGKQYYFYGENKQTANN